MRFRILAPILGSLCIGGGCSSSYSSSNAALVECPHDPPYGHYVKHTTPGYSICTSSSGISPPSDGGGSGDWDIWGMRGSGKSSSSGSGSGSGCSYSTGSPGTGSSGSGSTYQPKPCNHYDWVEGRTTCELECDDDTVMCSSACTSLYADANNCGACGRACKEQCYFGSCQPLTAIQTSTIQLLAIQGGAIYWSEANAIGRASLDTLAGRSYLSHRAIAGGPVADEASAVYWTEVTAGTLRVMKHEDGVSANHSVSADVAIHSQPGTARTTVARIAVDATDVYFTDEPEKVDDPGDGSSPVLLTPTTYAPYALFATSKLDGTTRTLASLSRASDVVFGGGFVYFIESNYAYCHLRRVRPEGGSGAVDDFANICPARLLAADGDAVYYDDGMSAIRMLHGDASTVRLPGSTALASDANAFYTVRGFDIVRTERDGKLQTVLAGLQTPTDLAVSGDRIYWANGKELRMARTWLP